MTAGVPRVEGLMGRAALLLQGAGVASEWLRHGNLTIEQKAVLAEGGTRFLATIASGDIPPQAAYEARLDACRGCPSKVVAAAREGVAESSWCGRPFEDRTGEDNPTCGCLIVLKAACAGEDCPQKRWPKIFCETA